jgi:hypothetical protein
MPRMVLEIRYLDIDPLHDLWAAELLPFMLGVEPGSSMWSCQKAPVDREADCHSLLRCVHAH